MNKVLLSSLISSILLMGCNANNGSQHVDSFDDDRTSKVEAQQGEQKVSKYWTDYLESRVEGSDLMQASYADDNGMIVPNFSYAGYERGDKAIPNLAAFADYRVFDITDFGAIANDKVSDKPAFFAAAKAINEYQSQGGGGAILSVPEGTFIVNADSDMADIDPSNKRDLTTKQVIQIYGSNIVFKGAGQGKTTLLMETNLLPVNPRQKWSTPYLFKLGGGDYKGGFATSIKQSVVGNSSYEISVADASGFKAGDFVELTGLITNPDTIAAELSPYKTEVNKKGVPLWKNFDKEWKKLEKHEIASVEGNTLRFHEPVEHDIDINDSWTVLNIKPAVQVGVQDFTLKGSWSGSFVHHADALHDSGYSFLNINRAAHSWIQNLDVINFNQGIQLSHTFNTTTKDVKLTGVAGHISVSFLYGNNNLSKDVQDLAHTWHAPGLSKYSTHNVHLRTTFSPNMGRDLHGAQGMDNLLDSGKGGWVKGHWGAALKDQPNHLKGLYFWNEENTGKPNSALTFMQSSGVYGRIIMPHMIGVHGNELKVQSQFKYMISAHKRGWAEYEGFPKRDVQQAYVESMGTPVKPASLYEAQLEYRHSLAK